MDYTRLLRSMVLAAAASALLVPATRADDVAWVFEGSTNRNASATASAASSSTLVTALDNGFVASSNSITMSTCPPGTVLVFR